MGRIRWLALVAGLLASNGAGWGLLYQERAKSLGSDAVVRKLSEQLTAAIARGDRVDLEKRRLSESTSTMTRRLHTRTVKAAVRNSSAVLLEAVPYVGIGAMLTVTALDLKDACDTMADINAVHSVMGIDPHDTNQVCGLKLPSLKEVMTSARTGCAKTGICDADVAQPNGSPTDPD